MNLLDETINLNAGLSEQARPVMQFLLEPKDGDVTCKQVLLNGRELIFNGVDPPTVADMGVPVNLTIAIPSHRYGMWVWRNV